MTTKRALIIDDDYANRSIWDLVLSDQGYEVVAAPDLATCLPHIKGDVSLYLVDYHLPDGRGTQVVSMIRENSPESVVIMTSMDDDADVIRESMNAGGNVFMVKPSSPLIMRQVLDEISAGALNATVRQLINRNGRRSYSQS